MPLINALLKHWLRLQCQMVATTSAGVLVSQDDAGSDHRVVRWPEQESVQPALLALARQVIAKQRLQLQPDGEALLLGQPVVVDGKFWGAVVLRIGKREKLDLQATLKLLQWGMTWLQFLLFQQGSDQRDSSTAGQEHLELLAGVLREPSLEEAAITLVNRLATRQQGERVSLGLCDKRGVELMAVSFSANFDRRTQVMQALTAAMQEAVEQRQDIHVTAQEEAADHPAQLLRCHRTLQQSNPAVEIHTFLLRHKQQVIGALLMEVPTAALLSATDQQWIEQLLSLVAPLLYFRKSASIGSMQAVRAGATGFLQRWFGPQHLKGRLVSGGLFVFLLVLLIPADYRVHSDAVVENIDQHVLVAPQDGYLGLINARPGERVTKQQLLAELNDAELTLERRKLASQLQQYRQEYDNALATANRSQAAIAAAQVEQASVQLRLIEQQLAQTKLTAPIDGTIVSDDIRQSLGAPVKQGEVLFEIAADAGYLVQLYVDERDITAIAPGQTGNLKLTSLPGDTLTFTVTHVTPVSEVRDGRNYFRVEASLDGENLSVRPGMTGSGRILAGRHLLGWIWFHDIWHWLRLTLWF